MPRERSAGAVIFKRDGTRKYLLLHYEARHWDFPKGNVEKDETAELTARREIREETGIEDVTFIPGFKEKISYFYRRGRSTVYKEVIFLLAKTGSEMVKLSPEHTGFEWLDYERAHEKVTYRSSKQILKKAERLLSSLEKGA